MNSHASQTPASVQEHASFNSDSLSHVSANAFVSKCVHTVNLETSETEGLFSGLDENITKIDPPQHSSSLSSSSMHVDIDSVELSQSPFVNVCRELQIEDPTTTTTTTQSAHGEDYTTQHYVRQST